MKNDERCTRSRDLYQDSAGLVFDSSCHSVKQVILIHNSSKNALLVRFGQFLDVQLERKRIWGRNSNSWPQRHGKRRWCCMWPRIKVYIACLFHWTKGVLETSPCNFGIGSQHIFIFHIYPQFNISASLTGSQSHLVSSNSMRRTSNRWYSNAMFMLCADRFGRKKPRKTSARRPCSALNCHTSSS